MLKNKVLFILITLFLFSCDDDDSVPIDVDILGRWYDYNTSECYDRATLTFNKNGTLVSRNQSGDCLFTDTSLDYEIFGNVLTITNRDFDFSLSYTVDIFLDSILILVSYETDEATSYYRKL